MSAGLHVLRPVSTALALCAVLAFAGCARHPGLGQAVSVWDPGRPVTDDVTLVQIGSLQTSLCALAPTVRADEAHRAARCAIEYSRQLAAEYRVVRPPFLHNFLVNTRIKKRGLCYEWTADLLAQLQALNLDTLDLNWGVARPGTLREHSGVVITARGEPFERGLVLDAWRRSGSLTWKPVADDKYPWEECEFDPTSP